MPSDAVWRNTAIDSTWGEPVDSEPTDNRSKEQLEAIVAQLASPEWPTRVDALESLRLALQQGCSRERAQMVRASLLSLVDDDSWKVRLSLVASLVALPPLAGVRDALQVLATDANRYVREAAARALHSKRAGASRWRITTDKEDPVFQAIRAEIKRINPSSLSESSFYEAAERIAGIAYRAVASDATHELNTVLSGIDGFADQLVRRLEKLGRRDSGIASLLTSLKERSALARRMVDDLRWYCSPPSEAFEDVPADGLLREAVRLAQERVGTSQRLPEVRLLDMGQAAVTVVKGRMLRALANIICNALEATAENGLVTAHVELSPGTVAFVIRDNGCGMSEEQLAAATKCFTTNRRAMGGTGMGLAIAQRVIEGEHRGRLELASAVGDGTTVTVMLPVGEGGEGELPS